MDLTEARFERPWGVGVVRAAKLLEHALNRFLLARRWRRVDWELACGPLWEPGGPEGVRVVVVRTLPADAADGRRWSVKCFLAGVGPPSPGAPARDPLAEARTWLAHAPGEPVDVRPVGRPTPREVWVLLRHPR